MGKPFTNTLKVSGFLAARSLFRGNKAVLGLTVFMLALVYINLLFFPALLNGLIQTINEKQIALGSGEFSLLPSNGKSYFTDAAALKDRISEIDGVEAIAGRTVLGTEIEFGGRVSTYGTYAVNPSEYTQVFDIERYMIEGEFLAPGDTNQIVLGIQVAGCDNEDVELYASSLQHVHVGDKVVVRTGIGSGIGDDDQGEHAVTLAVKGIFSTGTVQNDLRSFVSDRALGIAIPSRRDTASTLHVKMAVGYNETTLQNSLEALASVTSNTTSPSNSPLFTVVPWQDMAGIINSVTGTFESIITIIQGVSLLVGGITIFVVTYVDVVNKRRQIELQRNLGISGTAIVFSNALRAVVLSICSAALGAALYLCVVAPLVAAHPFVFPFGNAALVTSVSSFFAAGGVLVATSLLAAALPKV